MRRSLGDEPRVRIYVSEWPTGGTEYERIVKVGEEWSKRKGEDEKRKWSGQRGGREEQEGRWDRLILETWYDPKGR
jgi:hypothetical protein